VVSYILTLVTELLGILAWLVIVVLGRQPAGLQNALVFCLTYTTRANALLYLVTETYPPFSA
jgi:hypothetical protein